MSWKWKEALMQVEDMTKKNGRSGLRRSRSVPLVPALVKTTGSFSRKSEKSTKKEKTKRKNVEFDEFLNEFDDNNSGEHYTETDFKSTDESRAFVLWYHTMNKRISQITHDKSLEESDRMQRLNALKQQIEQRGGIQKYQEASIFGANSMTSNAFNSAHYVLTYLKKHKHFVNPSKPIKLLDVGAIDNQYIDSPHYSSSTLDLTLIDINPQHPDVQRIDFFDYSHQHILKNSHKHDVIVLSLVINYIGSAKERGHMLSYCIQDEMLTEHGLVFIILPNACIQNARYMKYSRMKSLIESIGFRQVSIEYSRRLVFWVFVKEEKSSRVPKYNRISKEFQYQREYARKLCRGGAKRNNFSIELKNS